MDLLKDKGAALPLVIIAVLVIAIISLSIYNITSNNIMMVKYQENYLKAHYLARSGIEIAYEALWADNGQLLENLDNLGKLGPETIELADGKVVVEVWQIKRGNRDWVVIQGIGSYKNTGIENKVILEFEKENPENQRWIN
ncbi:hypothetical protein [Anaerobranca gottschalkii]|uniref:PilX N-terminal n=1 Tax=Anaerobranca gottschalkii DSM 13577 TaxID=1120990 RepID=A0A1H9Y3J8_9FIRM|nr:hypothetical protein [Anaerobranca gottschalkii]SES63386.1 hypothetical protein SAMN03080614_1001139 [Anaerobranca gottschalkii DSM 13577]